MDIVLIGYRCSGKTTVGKVLAEKTGRSFADTDLLIEEGAGSALEEIVRREGWGGFRERERQVIRELSKESPLVIATGGGTVMGEDNVVELSKRGWIVWLKTGVSALKERMNKDMASERFRPSLTGKDAIAEIGAVLASRQTVYERACDLALDTDRLTVREVASRILSHFPGKERRS